MIPISFDNPLIAQAVRTASSSSTSGSTSSTSGSTNQLTGDSFIQLLAAQLKAQDPLNPLDPSTFVTQLVQFNQLQQLIDINQTLNLPSATSTGAKAQFANAPGNAILKS